MNNPINVTNAPRLISAQAVHYIEPGPCAQKVRVKKPRSSNNCYLVGHRVVHSRRRPWVFRFLAARKTRVEHSQRTPDVILTVGMPDGSTNVVRKPWRAMLRWLRASRIRALQHPRHGKDSYCAAATFPEIKAWLKGQIKQNRPNAEVSL